MKKISLLVATVLFISSVSFAQKSLTLKKGQKFLVETKTNTTSNTEVQGNSMETKVNSGTTYQIEVTDVTDSGYHLNSTITHVDMGMEMMGQEMKMNTDNKADLDGPLGSGLKDVINKPMSVVLDKTGKVVLQKKDKTDASNPVLQQIGNYEESGFGSEVAFIALPKDMKVGSTWSSEIKTKEANSNITFTVKAINGDLVTLSFTGTVSGENTIEQNGMEIVTKTSGKTTGESIVNSKTGVLQSSNSVADVSGNVEVMGQEMPTSAKTTTTTTVKSM
jgi:hypothetical protein